MSKTAAQSNRDELGGGTVGGIVGSTACGCQKKLRVTA